MTSDDKKPLGRVTGIPTEKMTSDDKNPLGRVMRIPAESCNHQIHVRVDGNTAISYCVKCGKILDTKQMPWDMTVKL